MTTFWHSLMQKLECIRRRERWAERRKRNKPEFPYSYRQASISQQLTRDLDDK